MKKYISYIFIAAVGIYFAYILYPAYSGKLGGTFKIAPTPPDYKALEKFLEDDGGFGRTLWVPQVQRYAFYTPNHPAVSATNFYHSTNTDEILSTLANPYSEDYLREQSIEYIIVPYDSHGEIFQSDRKYDAKQYKSTIEHLRKVNYLTEIKGMGRVAVFQLENPKPQFSTSNGKSHILSIRNNPTSYTLRVTGAAEKDIITFTDSFDPNWVATVSESAQKSEIYSQQNKAYHNNTFKPGVTGNFTLNISYKPQKIVNVSSIVSSIGLITVLIILIFTTFSKPRKKK